MGTYATKSQYKNNIKWWNLEGRSLAAQYLLALGWGGRVVEWPARLYLFSAVTLAELHVKSCFNLPCCKCSAEGGASNPIPLESINLINVIIYIN